MSALIGGNYFAALQDYISRKIAQVQFAYEVAETVESLAPRRRLSESYRATAPECPRFLTGVGS